MGQVSGETKPSKSEAPQCDDLLPGGATSVAGEQDLPEGRASRNRSRPQTTKRSGGLAPVPPSRRHGQPV